MLVHTVWPWGCESSATCLLLRGHVLHSALVLALEFTCALAREILALAFVSMWALGHDDVFFERELLQLLGRHFSLRLRNLVVGRSSRMATGWSRLRGR